MGICYLCGKETDLEYRCPYCNITFCEEHRLPEQHNCTNIPDRDWDVYRKESIRMGRIIPTQDKKDSLLDSFNRDLMQSGDSSKKEFEKDTGSSFIRKGAREDNNVVKENTMKSGDSSKEEFEKDTGSSFIRKGAREDNNVVKEKSGNINIIFIIIVIIILISLIFVLHEFGYINLYELCGSIRIRLIDVSARASSFQYSFQSPR